jgi:hypothetical protein
MPGLPKQEEPPRRKVEGANQSCAERDRADEAAGEVGGAGLF